MAAVTVCPKCGKPRNALTVHREENGDRACVDCIREGKPLERSVVLWIGQQPVEVMPTEATA